MNISDEGVHEQIRFYAKDLRLPSFLNYNEVLARASSGDSFAKLLLEMMKLEFERRRENQNANRLKQAGFPYTKTLDEMDLSRYKGKISEIAVGELASCQFIRDRRNVVMYGNPGRGKTHMAIGLGLKACELGMSVLFKNVARLSTELSEARDSYLLGRVQKKLERADLLILDEVGYVKFNRQQSEMLFNVFSDRSERGSIIVTTNLRFSEWTNVFDGKGLVAAMVDRLTFRAVMLDMNGESYRLEETMKGMKNEHGDAAVNSMLQCGGRDARGAEGQAADAGELAEAEGHEAEAPHGGCGDTEPQPCDRPEQHDVLKE